MNQAIPKRRRKRLAPEPYQVLRREILKRDGWRCQSCGLRGDLQIHHIERKSYLGDDCEKNLITLCSRLPSIGSQTIETGCAHIF